ncbi:hypothetical protein BDZ94DRAFT_1241916 [Collybia nuda]|uniref:Uncharacterized protein n=1 Tax=Collybia nuda TaxID=64659 RepID=A0A9P6C8F5_9AGAR|nr:hypothetical protein BDZ94DRAFT_1241916 [Collybia nuda]
MSIGIDDLRDRSVDVDWKAADIPDQLNDSLFMPDHLLASIHPENITSLAHSTPASLPKEATLLPNPLTKPKKNAAAPKSKAKKLVAVEPIVAKRALGPLEEVPHNGRTLHTPPPPQLAPAAIQSAAPAKVKVRAKPKIKTTMKKPLMPAGDTATVVKAVRFSSPVENVPSAQRRGNTERVLRPTRTCKIQ